MSVIKSNTGNTMYDYFSDLIEFNNMKDHLIYTQSFDEFLRWFDKLRILEPRATWIYLRRNKEKLTDEMINYAEKTYHRTL